MALYRSFFAVGGLTLVSRVLGFARDVLIAAVLGTGAVADAFFVAFRLPNLFRRLFAEGAFNSAFVPLFAKKLEGDGKDAAKRFAEDALSGLTYVLLLLSAVAIGGMPWLMLVLAPGYADNAEKFEMSVLFGRIAFPYLLCMSLMALYAGVLSSLGKYAAAAAAQILLNVVLTTAIAIAYAMGFANTPGAGLILAVAVSVAGVIQLVMIARDAARNGMVLSPRWPRLTPDIRRLVTLGVPALIAGGVTQINIVVGTSIASLQDGAVSYLYYADRLYQLPLGIVGIAVGVVLLSDVSRLLRAGDLTAVIWSQNRSIEFALMMTLPAAVALAVVPSPIIAVLFERGAFTAADTPPTAMALAAFAVGLPAFVLARVLSPAFFAREDTRTPMRYAVVNMVLNVALSVGLFFWFKAQGWMPHIGIAIATTIAGWVNALQLWWTLDRRGDFKWDGQLARTLPLMLLSSLLMGGALWFAGQVLAPYFATTQPLLVRVSALAALVGSGFAIYATLIIATGVLNLRQIREMMQRKKDERASGGGSGPAGGGLGD
ncbi:MAG: murein biosynthesis integral membrane protein MurJ [Hyphomicrobium aestuarii]|nr:murein biosynthesis integral membrane protein MurJ [Hyphomicrobium aestuarii]